MSAPSSTSTRSSVMAQNAQAIAEAEPPTAQALAQLKAEAAPLIERRAAVEAELAALDTSAAPSNAPLDEAIKARREAGAARSALEAERDVISERLQPLEEEIARLEAEVRAEQANAQRKAAVDAGLAALARITAAREVLEAEVMAFFQAAARTPRGRTGTPPELHFAAQGEIEKIVLAARRLEGAV